MSLHVVSSSTRQYIEEDQAFCCRLIWPLSYLFPSACIGRLYLLHRKEMLNDDSKGSIGIFQFIPTTVLARKDKILAVGGGGGGEVLLVINEATAKRAWESSNLFLLRNWQEKTRSIMISFHK